MSDPKAASESSVGIDFVPDSNDTAKTDETQAESPIGAADESFGCDPDHVSLSTCGGWQRFDLLPQSYRNTKNAVRVFCAWLSIVFIALATTSGVAVYTLVSGQNEIAKKRDLVQRAKPIALLKRRIELMEVENEKIQQSASWVESAKPQNDILQIIAAVAAKTHPYETSIMDNELDVQSIVVKLPLEYDTTMPVPPNWATPKFSLSVIAKRQAAVGTWAEQLSNIVWLDQVNVKNPSGIWREARIEVNALPRTTRTVP